MAASAVALMTLVSAGPASANVNREVWFTIQNNNVCDSANRYTSIFLNINNISSSDADVTVNLYDDTGTPLTTTGDTPTGTLYFPTDFSLGSSFTIDASTTRHYILTIGGSETAASCSVRPAYGKITVDSDSGFLMANGEIKGTLTGSPNIILTNTPISINNGQPF